MHASRWIGLLAITALSAPSPAGAQHFPGSEAPSRSGFGIHLAGAYGIMAGEVGDSVGGGLQLEAIAFHQPRDLPFRFGGGGGYSWFGFDRADGTLRKLSLFGLATLMIPSMDTEMVPYVQVRAGWTRLSDDQGCGPPYELREEFCGGDPDEVVPGGRIRSGLELGAAVGVDIPVAERISLDVGGSFSWLNLGEIRFGGTSLPFTDASGSAFSLRAGAAYFFGP
jgi:hypothetical protein